MPWGKMIGLRHRLIHGYRYWRLLLLVLFYAGYGLVYTGWLFHECHPRHILQYSTTYFLFLCFMAVGFLSPHFIRSYRSLVGRRAFNVSAISTLVILSVGHGLASNVYYYTRAHPFDPFLQHPPPLFEDYPKEKGPNTIRILTLGGSTTRCITMEQSQRYPSVLRRLLQEHYPSLDIEVMNGGMDWFTTKHCLIHYLTYAQDWNPDIIVFMEAINDLYRSFAPPDFAVGSYNDLWSHFYGPAIRGAQPPTYEQHLFSSYGLLGRLASTWFSQLRERQIDYPLETYRSMVPFRANLEKLIRYTKANGSELMLMTQPSLYKEDMSEQELLELEFPKLYCVTRMGWFYRDCPTARSMKSAMDAFNAVVRRTALENGVVLIDAEAQIAKDTTNFTDDVHYTVRGAARMADAVARAIIAEEIIDRVAAR